MGAAFFGEPLIEKRTSTNHCAFYLPMPLSNMKTNQSTDVLYEWLKTFGSVQALKNEREYGQPPYILPQ